MDFQAVNTTEFMAMSTEESTFRRTPIFTETLYCLIATLGILGNGLVLFVFYKVPSLRVTTNILIGNQSLIDFVASLCLLLNFVPPEGNLGSLEERNPALAVIICKLWHSDYSYWALVTISTTNLIFITLERYLAVVFPHQYRRRVNARTTRAVCLLAWLIGAAIKVYIPILHTIGEDGDCSSRSDWRVVIGCSSLITTIIIPLSVMIFAYTSIIRTLRPVKLAYKRDGDTAADISTDVTLVSYSTNLEQGSAMPSANQSGSSSSIPADLLESETGDKGGKIKAAKQNKGKKKLSTTERAKRNVLVTMLIVCITYVICWTPNQILYFHHNVVERHDWSDPFHRLSIVLASSNVCTNPFIYTLKYRSFQNGLRKVFSRKG